mmetsp:Transcript_10766/g.35668  ORF Transcript_10766/g.35668 Transcript_10766/m.35668 type:complete len:124 (-) Transcript_10766:471-842(-)
MISSAVRWLSLLTHSLSPVPMGAAESSSVPAAPPETLPDFFPLAPKACASQSAKFFECFATKGIQNAGEEDPDAGQKALADCARTLAAYEKCMTRWRRRHEPVFYRVQEEYRTLSEELRHDSQ